MKLFVCANCGNSVESFTWRNSFEKEGKRHCSTCGELFYEQEITPEQLNKLEKKHNIWTTRTAIIFEVILGLFVLAAFVLLKG